jgi:hypothetical protein
MECISGSRLPDLLFDYRFVVYLTCTTKLKCKHLPWRGTRSGPLGFVKNKLLLYYPVIIVSTRQFLIESISCALRCACVWLESLSVMSTVETRKQDGILDETHATTDSFSWSKVPIKGLAHDRGRPLVCPQYTHPKGSPHFNSQRRNPPLQLTYYGARLRTHPSNLVVNLLGLPDNRRLRRYLPNDLPARFLM